MKIPILSGVLFLLSITYAFSQLNTNNGTKKNVLAVVDKSLQDAAVQYKYFGTVIPESQFPRSLDKLGKLTTSDSKWWCSGFYPGTLIYLYENSKDNILYAEALKKMKLLEKEQFNKSTHDLGFMMYCSYGNANRLNADPKYKEILVNSAKSLSTRFSPITGSIRSWDPKRDNDYIVIIDNMMNLELLFYATKVTGDSSFYKIAVTHANNTMENHFRPDYSSYHVVDYNPQTGKVDNKRTHQGAANNSAWARGQAWALYGYTIMYRETKDKKYLSLANNIANFILKHPKLPADKVPYWDFNAPGIPDAPRDASAAAVYASALLELSLYNKNVKRKEYTSAAESIILSLSSTAYKATTGENGGFLLKHSVGSLPHKSEVDVPLTYADYYYVEALMRYKALTANKSFLW